MSKIRLLCGTDYQIEDYATENSFTILLDDIYASRVLETLTEENLSEIQFLTDSGTVIGIYHNKLLCSYTDNGDTLAVSINDADLCRYGLILDENNRIVDAPVQRYAPEDVIIVDKLPEGNLPDYQYINGEFIYNPLLKEEPVEVPSQLDILDSRVTYLAMMTDNLYWEV